MVSGKTKQQNIKKQSIITTAFLVPFLLIVGSAMFSSYLNPESAHSQHPSPNDRAVYLVVSVFCFSLAIVSAAGLIVNLKYNLFDPKVRRSPELGPLFGKLKFYGMLLPSLAMPFVWINTLPPVSFWSKVFDAATMIFFGSSVVFFAFRMIRIWLKIVKIRKAMDLEPSSPFRQGSGQ